MAQVVVQVFEEFADLVSEQWLHRIAQRAISLQDARASQDLSVVVADDETVRDLNRRHRGLDQETDVLAFSFCRQGEYYGDDPQPPASPPGEEFVLPPKTEAGLGEVVISYSQAARQAAQAGHSTRRELALLLAHGVLHLLGYDHTEPDEEAVMEVKQANLLARMLEDG